MKSLWTDGDARACGDDPLRLRVYTSRLLGGEPSLVLDGGGNTSVKTEAANLFGEREKVLYIKASGRDLQTISAAGFAPVRLDVLLRMAELDALSDADLVRAQRAAMADPDAPDPSLEAILHALIPLTYVDHTHADAVVTISNTPKGEARIRELFGERVLVVPYVMPGFRLARKVYEMTRDIDWQSLEGMVLQSHGVFTFADDARTSYERMIGIASDAESYLARYGAGWGTGSGGGGEPDGGTGAGPGSPERGETGGGRGEGRADAETLLELARVRGAVSKVRGGAMIARLDTSRESVAFSNLKNVASIATRGPLTPNHVIRAKRVPLVIDQRPADDVARYARDYKKYFERHRDGRLTMLDAAPRWAVWPGHGIVAFGRTTGDVAAVTGIALHTTRAIRRAEALGGWKALPERDIFEVEYWELEQKKLSGRDDPGAFAGKVVLVTGGASGIGRACVEMFRAGGAAVAALDIDPGVTATFDDPGILGVVCDVTDDGAVAGAVADAVGTFGGLDIVVSNAGIFPASESIADMSPETWERSLAINLSSHQTLLKTAVPYLETGIDPAVVVIGSKNVAAPGPGASAYSVAKAGLTQLGRVAALELAPLGIRVNMIHPNNVFDTAIWTDEVLAERAKRYGMSVEEYKTNNLLRVDVTSRDVARLACDMAGPAFSKTTGAQVPIDGGNDRVI
ncbi:MAG: bifunctional aldolase/short-chain dehydrogenase [Candidatus Krumholzibacteriia bacterium]